MWRREEAEGAPRVVKPSCPYVRRPSLCEMYIKAAPLFAGARYGGGGNMALALVKVEGAG